MKKAEQVRLMLVSIASVNGGNKKLAEEAMTRLKEAEKRIKIKRKKEESPYFVKTPDL